MDENKVNCLHELGYSFTQNIPNTNMLGPVCSLALTNSSSPFKVGLRSCSSVLFKDYSISVKWLQ